MGPSVVGWCCKQFILHYNRLLIIVFYEINMKSTGTNSIELRFFTRKFNV